MRLPRSGGKVNSTKTPSNLILKAPEEKETKKTKGASGGRCFEIVQ